MGIARRFLGSEVVGQDPLNSPNQRAHIRLWSAPKGIDVASALMFVVLSLVMGAVMVGTVLVLIFLARRFDRSRGK